MVNISRVEIIQACFHIQVHHPGKMADVNLVVDLRQPHQAKPQLRHLTDIDTHVFLLLLFLFSAYGAIAPAAKQCCQFRHHRHLRGAGNPSRPGCMIASIIQDGFSADYAFCARFDTFPGLPGPRYSRQSIVRSSNCGVSPTKSSICSRTARRNRYRSMSSVF